MSDSGRNSSSSQMWFGFGQEVNQQIKAQILSTDLLNPAGLAGGCLQETVTHFYCDHKKKNESDQLCGRAGCGGGTVSGGLSMWL